jgi:hypothetical protein
MPQSPKHVTVSATRVNETRRCIMLLHDLRKQATEVEDVGICLAIKTLGERRGALIRELSEHEKRSGGEKP